MIQIDTFNLIEIKSNTLVLSDIDETILFYILEFYVSLLAVRLSKIIYLESTSLNLLI
jgi:hypothetical protein